MRSPGLTIPQLNHFARDIATGLRVLAAVLAFLVILALFSPLANAATTFDASVTAANGELTTTLTWESTQSQCVGSGHPAWDGPKEASGTLQLPTITLSGTYTLTLECSTPADRTARISWTNPTTNTDGTPLTNLAGIRIHYGRSADVLSSTVDVTPAGRTTYTIEDLALGEWFFAARAYNSAGAESALSNTVSKTITEGTSESDTVTLTVNPIPNGVTGFEVE